jgi:hypothetical protein
MHNLGEMRKLAGKAWEPAKPRQGILLAMAGSWHASELLLKTCPDEGLASIGRA